MGNWTASQMVMTQRDWAKMNTGKHPLTIVQDGPDVVACVWADDDGDEAKFARLISAAPELLAACRAAKATHMLTESEAGLPSLTEVAAMLTAAISKAEGSV